MYQYIQTIDITSLNYYCGVMVGIQIWYRNKQYFAITDTVITRDHCTMFISQSLAKKVLNCESLLKTAVLMKISPNDVLPSVKSMSIGSPNFQACFEKLAKSDCCHFVASPWSIVITNTTANVIHGQRGFFSWLPQTPERRDV
jgi:hypothetical protein